MSIGRQVAICEFIELMQILPGPSDDAPLVNTSRDFCKLARANDAVLQQMWFYSRCLAIS
jgi:hypothetical protein